MMPRWDDMSRWEYWKTSLILSLRIRWEIVKFWLKQTYQDKIFVVELEYRIQTEGKPENVTNLQKLGVISKSIAIAKERARNYFCIKSPELYNWIKVKSIIQCPARDRSLTDEVASLKKQGIIFIDDMV